MHGDLIKRDDSLHPPATPSPARGRLTQVPAVLVGAGLRNPFQQSSHLSRRQLSASGSPAGAAPPRGALRRPCSPPAQRAAGPCGRRRPLSCSAGRGSGPPWGGSRGRVHEAVTPYSSRLLMPIPLQVVSGRSLCCLCAARISLRKTVGTGRSILSLSCMTLASSLHVARCPLP